MNSGPNNPEKLNPALFVPFVSNPIFPEKVRKFFRFGVRELGEFSININKKKEIKTNCKAGEDIETPMMMNDLKT